MSDDARAQSPQGQLPAESLELKRPPAQGTWSTRLLDLVFPSHSGKLKDPAIEDVKRGEPSETKARKDVEAGHRRRQREADRRAREEKREASRERAQKYKQNKESQKAEERKTQDYYTSGVFWGFDPNAGMLRAERGTPNVTSPGGAVDRSNDPLTPSSTPSVRPVRGQTWGVQHGEQSKSSEP